MKNIFKAKEQDIVFQNVKITCKDIIANQRNTISTIYFFDKQSPIHVGELITYLKIKECFCSNDFLDKNIQYTFEVKIFNDKTIVFIGNIIDYSLNENKSYSLKFSGNIVKVK